MPCSEADRLTPPRAGAPVLGDRAQLERARSERLRQVVVVILRAARLGLKPLAPQPEPLRKRVQLLGRVGLEVAAAAPSPPLAVGEGMIDVDAHVVGPSAWRDESGARMLARYLAGDAACAEG